MATFKDLSTFFHHLIEEFSLETGSTKGVTLDTATHVEKEKVFVNVLSLVHETGLTRGEVEAKLTKIQSLHPGIYRRGEIYSYD